VTASRHRGDGGHNLYSFFVDPADALQEASFCDFQWRSAAQRRHWTRFEFPRLTIYDRC